MKKILFLGLIGLLSITGNMARAQFADYGVRVGAGLATISDDLSTKSPIIGATVGGYINFTFHNTQSIAGEFLYLQSGLNLNRRGSNFHEVLENENTLSVRDGFYHAYYLQLPVLVGFRLELPVREPGHIAGIFVGPAVNYGLFGRCKDRVVTPGNPSPATNYDNSIINTPSFTISDNMSEAEVAAVRAAEVAAKAEARRQRAVFNHLRRLDVGVVVGFTYEYGPWSAMLYMDHGFMATSTEPDILRIITQSMDQSGSGNGSLKTEIPNGNNTAFMLSIGYALGNFMDR